MSHSIPFPKNAANTLMLVNEFDRMLRTALNSPQNFATHWPSLLRLLVVIMPALSEYNVPGSFLADHVGQLFESAWHANTVADVNQVRAMVTSFDQSSRPRTIQPPIPSQTPVPPPATSQPPVPPSAGPPPPAPPMAMPPPPVPPTAAVQEARPSAGGKKRVPAVATSRPRPVPPAKPNAKSKSTKGKEVAREEEEEEEEDQLEDDREQKLQKEKERKAKAKKEKKEKEQQEKEREQKAQDKTQPPAKKAPAKKAAAKKVAVPKTQEPAKEQTEQGGTDNAQKGKGRKKAPQVSNSGGNDNVDQVGDTRPAKPTKADAPKAAPSASKSTSTPPPGNADESQPAPPPKRLVKRKPPPPLEERIQVSQSCSRCERARHECYLTISSKSHKRACFECTQCKIQCSFTPNIRRLRNHPPNTVLGRVDAHKRKYAGEDSDANETEVEYDEDGTLLLPNDLVSIVSTLVHENDHLRQTMMEENTLLRRDLSTLTGRLNMFLEQYGTVTTSIVRNAVNSTIDSRLMHEEQGQHVHDVPMRVLRSPSITTPAGSPARASSIGSHMPLDNECETSGDQHDNKTNEAKSAKDDSTAVEDEVSNNGRKGEGKVDHSGDSGGKNDDEMGGNVDEMSDDGNDQVDQGSAANVAREERKVDDESDNGDRVDGESGRKVAVNDVQDAEGEGIHHGVEDATTNNNNQVDHTPIEAPPVDEEMETATLGVETSGEQADTTDAPTPSSSLTTLLTEEEEARPTTPPPAERTGIQTRSSRKPKRKTDEADTGDQPATKKAKSTQPATGKASSSRKRKAT